MATQPTYDPAIAVRRDLGIWESQRAQAKDEFIAAINARGNEISALKDSIGTRSERFKDAEELRIDAEREFNHIKATVKRPVNRHEFSSLWIAVFAVALALLEAPANKYLFDVALKSAGIVSILVSVFVAFVVLILAHYAGRAIRQVWSEYRHRIVWSNLLFFLGMLAAFFAVVSIITIARAKTAADAELSGFGDLLSAVSAQVAELGFWASLSAAFGEISALVLAIVNIGGIVVTMAISYFNYDPDKDFDSAKNNLEKRRAEIQKLNRAFADKQTAIIKRFAPDLNGAGSNHKIANGHVIELKRQLGMPLEPEDMEHIDELDTMAEDADRREWGGTLEEAPGEPPVPPTPPPSVTPIDGRMRREAVPPAQKR
jgi:hypothetical protein